MCIGALQGLSPGNFWKRFYEISQIPRCSGKEGKILRYLKKFAEDHDLKWKQDVVGNVVIRKAAAPGYENRPIVILQGHVDMVCEKNEGTDHDFSTDPIKLRREGEWLTADGTTLGADNGIAVAAALAVLEDKGLEHGPIEALFTVDEETGLTGALKLDPAILEGKILLNLDSEEEGTFYIGCAGGKHTRGFFPVEFEAPPDECIAYEAVVSGLRGGHSGVDIHLGLGNAIRLGIRYLNVLSEELGIRIYDIHGGGKHNAIPREMFVKFLVSPRDEKKVEDTAREYDGIFKKEQGDIEPEVQLSLKRLEENPSSVFSQSFTRKIIRVLYAMPHGVIGMSRAVEDLVETSTNLAAVSLREQEVEILTSQRSSRISAREDIAARMMSLIQLSGGQGRHESAYPPWEPDPGSELLAASKMVYQKLTGKDPLIKAIHAGLECGVIGAKFKGMTMISFGPDLEGVHTPEERIKINTVESFWNFLLALLKEIK